MSKSIGNVMSMDVLLHQVPAVVIRYLLATPHYRSNIEVVVPASLDEARTAYERIENFVLRAAEACGDAVTHVEPADLPVPGAFTEAMDDDLGTSAALAVVHDTVRAGNTALAAGDKDGALAHALAVRAMTEVIGIDPLDPHWRNGSAPGSDPARAALGALVQADLDARAAARAGRDFTTADAVRARLAAAGIAVEDTPDGARWSLASPATEEN